MRLVRPSIILALLLVVVATVPTCPAKAVGESASQRVDQLHETILRVMIDAKKLGYDGRYRELAPAVARSYNLHLITRLSIGRYWKNLQPEEREWLIDAVSRLTIATYAARFNGYSGQSFQVISEELADPNAAVVRSRLNRPDDTPIALDYVLRNSSNGWQIVDVFLDGKYSELARRRSEYTGVIGQSSAAALIQVIDQKIAYLKKRADAR